MNETLEMSYQPTLLDMTDAISSAALESGNTHCYEQSGLRKDASGRDRVLANLSARQAKELGLMTSGTYGRISSISSKSADLTQSLANRLRVRTDLLGSTLYRLIWKASATPSGRLIFRLRASAVRTTDSGFTSWPTPKEQNSRGPSIKGDGLYDIAQLASWAIPTSRDHKDGAANLDNVPVNALLGRQVLQTDSGETPNGSSAETEKHDRYRLNPRFSLWLMGIPPEEWACCGERATLSMQKRRRRSSKV